MSITVAIVPTPIPAFVARGRRVVLDADLAQLMEVPTKRLNGQVRQHPARFPAIGRDIAA